MYKLPSQKPSGGRNIKIFYSNQMSNKTISKYSTIRKVQYYQLKVLKVKLFLYKIGLVTDILLGNLSFDYQYCMNSVVAVISSSGSQPKAHKINLRGAEIINGVENKKKVCYIN